MSTRVEGASHGLKVLTMANLFAAFVGIGFALYPLSNYRNSHCTGELCPFGNAHRGQRANYGELVRRIIQ